MRKKRIKLILNENSDDSYSSVYMSGSISPEDKQSTIDSIRCLKKDLYCNKCEKKGHTYNYKKCLNRLTRK